jgi:hypothetical protein
MGNPSDKGKGAPQAPQNPATPARAPAAPSVAPVIPSVAPVVPAGTPTARPAAPRPATGAPIIPPAPPSIAPVMPPVAPAMPAMPPRPAPMAARPAPPAIAPQIAPGARPAMPAQPAPQRAAAPVAPPVSPARGGTPAMPRPAAATAPAPIVLSQPKAPVAPAKPAPVLTKGEIALGPDQLIDLERRTSQLDELDYFELLRLPQSAAPTEIKRAFYQESRTYHPDRFFHVADVKLKERINELYKRVTEAYYVLRDDGKRRKYLADINGPERAQKLRFNEASEVETKVAAKKEQEEQIGSHPKGRQFYLVGVSDLEAGRLPAAERNLKMALTYEPSNPRYKEKLTEVQQKLKTESQGGSGGGFAIK